MAAPGVCLPSQDGRCGLCSAGPEAARPPAAGPALGVGLWGPAARIPAPGTWRSVPARCGGGRSRPAAASLLGPWTSAGPVRGNRPGASSSPSRAKGQVEPPPPGLAFAPRGGDPARPFSKASVPASFLPGTVFRGLFTAMFLVVSV